MVYIFNRNFESLHVKTKPESTNEKLEWMCWIFGEFFKITDSVIVHFSFFFCGWGVSTTYCLVGFLYLIAYKSSWFVKCKYIIVEEQ